MKSSNPKITVYITNHNYGQFIEQSIESVLNQTMHDYEILVIDDGSTDNSREVIEKYMENEKIRIIFQQNKGLNVTNNIAMRTAQGKYLMRLDADDYLDPNALLVLSNALESDSQLGMVFPDYYNVDARGNILSIEKRHDFSSDVKLFDQPAHGACTMIRRDFLMQLNGYNENYECQDGYELWIKFIDHFKVSNINTPLFYYRQHGKNLTSNESRILKTRAKIKEDFLKTNGAQTSSAIAVIPIRGQKNSRKNLAFEQIDGVYLIDYKIRETKKARSISEIVVTSPDLDLKAYIDDHYKNEPKVNFVERGVQLARLNTDLNGTVEHLFDSNVVHTDHEAIITLGIEYPFINSDTIDDAINTTKIFKSDSLISVRPETNMFFQHDGSGMKPILNQDKFTKLEREALYKHIGGISVVTTKYFREHKKIIGGKVGHIVIDQKAAHGIFSDYDLDMARYLATKN